MRDIDVCICSYRRPEIAATMRAVSVQTGLGNARLRVVVADNTKGAETRDVVLDAAAACGLNVAYVHAPADNISIARNACLDAARAPWIAFLDDDEIPSPGWLAELMVEAEREGWDAVLGPVDAVYPETSPQWLIGSDFHSTRPVWVQGEIRKGYTGNVLFRREAVERHHLRFRVELGASGGEDDDFFYRFTDAGFRIGYARAAVAYERVQPARTTLAWLLRRSFRAGQSHGARLVCQHRFLRNISVALAKSAACTAGTLLSLPDAATRTRYLTRAALHIGAAARLAGFKEIRLY